MASQRHGPPHTGSSPGSPGPSGRPEVMLDAATLAGIDEAARLWRASRHAVAFTGAGISVPSGIPDFRSSGGLWSRYDPQEVASILALHRNPRAVWEFLLDAMARFGDAAPNPAHLALAELERGGRLSAVITQNIDSLHQRAGSTKVIEFHGNCREFHCMRCSRDYPPEGALGLTMDTIPWLCEECEGVVRPSVVFFGEGIPPQAQRDSQTETGAADLLLVAGTSGDVAPANTFPYRVKARGGRVIEVNLGPTAYGDMPDIRLDAPVETVLPLLADRILDPSLS